MYAIRLENDNSISKEFTSNINIGYKNSNWFWLIMAKYYNGGNYIKYDTYIEYTLPQSKNIITEKMILIDDYNNQLKYTLPYSNYYITQITNEIGVVNAKIIIKKSDNSVIRQSKEFSLRVSDDDDYHSDTDYKPIDNTIDSDENIEKIVNKTKPSQFNSIEEAIIALNSGSIKNIYYGKEIIIFENNRYTTYTVQQGINGYTIEPVDIKGGDGTPQDLDFEPITSEELAEMWRD